MDNTELEELLQQIRRLFAAEYARGDRDAIGRIMQAAKGDAVAETIKKTPLRRVRATLTARRAKNGAVDGLIKRVLTERRVRGAGALEIQQAAFTAPEKAVSYSGIRFALERGRKGGMYKNKDGKWFLVENKAAEHQRAAE
jgi:hypothetical protein